MGKVEELRPETSGHDLIVKVLDAKIVVDKPARGSLKAQRVAECTVGDETGTILFTARNEQVELVTAGSYVALTNAKIDMFRGSMRLAVGQGGKVAAAPGQSFSPKQDFNLSLIEYELVPVPTPAAPPAQEAEQEAAPAAPASKQGGEEGGEPAGGAANGAAEFEEAEAPPAAAAAAGGTT
ncbi:hypothetical protein D9Q98_007940 [Chlorella vulgaris]|uniref:Single-stranded DNA binding protein Ssb-like OB fold domain-containing protein n=1 Tax=Chlorella vulgaris TaxID=3077 RepID=A0A9D4YU58_CHLVU|nr:hypothetical protein D9Q98_007940 [Chlorella vulgaris]